MTLMSEELDNGDGRPQIGPSKGGIYKARAASVARECSRFLRTHLESQPPKSNRNYRKPELLQVIENKQSDPILIATFRGCFQGLFCNVFVSKPASLELPILNLASARISP
jgi:hypothetical protein